MKANIYEELISRCFLYKVRTLKKIQRKDNIVNWEYTKAYVQHGHMWDSVKSNK